MRRPTWLRASAFLGVSFIASAASGQDVQPMSEEERVERAVTEAQLGTELFERGEYEAAARSFGRAYDFYPLPEVMKSRIVAHFEGGDCASVEQLATEHDAELRKLPPVEQTDLGRMRTRCAILYAEDALAEADVERATAAIAAAERHDDEGARSDEIEALRGRLEDLEAQADASSNADPIEPVEPVEPPAENDRWRSILGWSLVGGGAAAMASVPLMHYAFYERSLEEHKSFQRGEGTDDTPRAEAEQRLKRLRTAYYAQFPLFIGGAVMSGIGATLLFLRPREDVDLSVSPGGVEVTITF